MTELVVTEKPREARVKSRTSSRQAMVSYADWYKDAIIYQLHVRAFSDSNDDGIGDFRGLTERLAYLKDLGVTALWLLPFYPSPLRDDGYDISDYTRIHQSYGSLEDFKAFLHEAHRLGLQVITELVINHTSDQHAWFQRARRAKPGDPARDFYVWSDTDEKYRSARIIFKDFETSNWTWDPVANAYYWHRFYSHQPDLNFDNPKVLKAVMDVMDFWFDLGVDGLRLDAVPYLHEREGTSCENLPETHMVLRKLRAHVDHKHKNKMLLAEANQWAESAVEYFGNGDECHMAFHFPLMPRMYMSMAMEDRFPVVDILNQTPQIPENCQWASFLRNHDELTLEMVTDEERDYMYRIYAHDPRMRINLGIRRRLAPLLGNDRRRIELMNGLLFSLPGTPIVYYGDEIGMGDNVYLGDRNGVRTPLQWSCDRNAGFSRANPQKLFLPVTIDPEYHYEAVNVEAQQQNPHSLLWWMKRLIAIAKKYKAFNRGTVEFVEPENRKVLAFIRKHENERILVVANLSRHVQAAELDLSAYEGMIPRELFGGTEFPAVARWPFFLTLGPHAFYWFSLEERARDAADLARERRVIPDLAIEVRQPKLLLELLKETIERALETYLPQWRWFVTRASRIKSVELVDRIAVPESHEFASVTFLRVEFVDGDPATYVVPMAVALSEKADRMLAKRPESVILSFQEKDSGSRGVVYDCVSDPEFMTWLLDSLVHSHGARGNNGFTYAWLAYEARKRRAEIVKAADCASYMGGEFQNDTISYGDKFVLKLFRRVEEGKNPELEMSRYLSERKGFSQVPHAIGSLEYATKGHDPITLAVAQALVPNEGDAWSLAKGFLAQYCESVLIRGNATSPIPVPNFQEIVHAATSEEGIPTEVKEHVEPFLSLAVLMGRRAMDLHRTLAAEDMDPDFMPEPFTPFYQRSLFQSFRNIADRTVSRLRKSVGGLPEDMRDDLRKLLDRRDEMTAVYQPFITKDFNAKRTRLHGDFHLKQLLFTGRDFVIVDFEGEVTRSLGERKLKRSPLRDIAGMVRSFDYAARVSLQGGQIRPDDVPVLGPWIDAWVGWTSAAFLRGYLENRGDADFLPRAEQEIGEMLKSYVLEKALHEILYEIQNRPEMLRIPLSAILRLLDEPR